MSNISDDEFTCLMIAEKGQYLAPIGRWKASILSLTEKGFLEKKNDVNFTITEAGRAACVERDRLDDEPLRRLLESSNAVAKARTEAQQHVEQAALHLSYAAKASRSATGDSLKHAIDSWIDIVKERALELAHQNG